VNTVVEGDLATGRCGIRAAFRESCDQMNVLLQDVNTGEGTGNRVCENGMPMSNVPFQIHCQDPSKDVLPTMEKAVQVWRLGAHCCESIKEGLIKLVLRDAMGSLDTTARNPVLHLHIS